MAPTKINLLMSKGLYVFVLFFGGRGGGLPVSSEKGACSPELKTQGRIFMGL